MTKIIYVNGSYKGEVGVPLDDLIHDFFCDNPADMRHKQLANRVKFLKSNEGMIEMRSALDDFLEQTKKETLLDSIRNLMDSTKWSLEKVMDALKIPPELQRELKPLF